MFYVYVMQSCKDGKFYTGLTDDLVRRIEEHNNKEEPSTKSRVPFKLVYYEACLSKKDAIVRERCLKSGRGKRYLTSRIKYYLEQARTGA